MKGGTGRPGGSQQRAVGFARGDRNTRYLTGKLACSPSAIKTSLPMPPSSLHSFLGCAPFPSRNAFLFDARRRLFYSCGMSDSSNASGDTRPPSPPDPDDKSVDHVAEAKAIFRRLGPAGILAVLSMALPFIGVALLIGTVSRVGPWLQSHGSTGVALYIAGFSILAGLALMNTWAQAVVGGWAFKHVLGSTAAVAGYTGAAIIGYLIARKASGDRVVEIIEERPKWRAVYDTLLQSGFGKTLLIVTLIRTAPSSPFALTNLVLAATRVGPLPYLLGTIIGMAPRTIVAACIGANLSELDLANTKETWMVIAGIVLSVIVVVIIGHMANQAIAKVTAQNSDSDESAEVGD